MIDPRSAAPAPSPAVRSRRQFLGAPRWVAGALLALGFAGYLILSREPERSRPPVSTPPPVRTRVVELRVRDYPVIIRSQGVVRARDEVILSAQVPGRVARVAPGFEDGAFFREGDVLVELEADDFRTAVALAEARVQSTAAAATLAELNQRREAEMLRDRLLPAAQAEVSTATLAQARAESAAAAAQLERARRDLDRARVRAPFAGCVRRRAVGPGQWVTPGSPLGSVFAVDAAEVRLPVSGPALEYLELPGERGPRGDDPRGSAAGTTVPGESPSEPPLEVHLRNSLAAASSPLWRGRVVRGEQALDGDTLERFVVVRVEDPFGHAAGLPALRPGQPVTGLLPGRVLTNVLVLPRPAVRELDRVYLVDPRTLTLSSRRVTALWSDEEQVVVRDPSIPDGTLLAVTHLVYAPDGATVEIIPDLPAGGRGTNHASVAAGRAP